MIKIEKQSDFLKLENIKEIIQAFIKIHFDNLCKQFDTDSLKSIGEIFYMSDRNDLDLYENVGLSLKFDEAIYESSDMLILDNGNYRTTIFKVIYILSNDKAITVVFDMDCLDKSTKSWLLEDCTERIVYL